MPLVQRLHILLFIGIFTAIPLTVFAQTATPTNSSTNSPTRTATRTPSDTRTITPTRTPTNTPTQTLTKTPSGTPTQSPTYTDSFTPNPTLTPPCGGSFYTLGATSGSPGGSSSNTMRSSLFNLASPATVYSLWLLCPSPGTQVMTGIYSGSVSNVGSLIVSSTVQTSITGWNAFSITPTYLPAGSYWLAYSYNTASYTVYTTSSTTANALAYTSGTVAFGTMPGTMPGPISYDSVSPFASDVIYTVYCNAPTPTPTPSNTPTLSNTSTFSPTWTITFTPTNTGTIFTNTPSPTNTLSPTLTPTVTNTITLSPTPNASLTPDCGAGAVSFGDPNTSGGPVTAFSNLAFRACRYTLNQSGTVETMSLYLPAQDAGEYFVTTALYSNGPSTVVGNLLTQAVTYQMSTGGWNTFQVAPTPLLAGDYWLAYMYSGGSPSTFALDFQSSPPVGNTAGGNTACSYGPPPALPGFKFPTTGSFIPTLQPTPPPPTPDPNSYFSNFYEPIVANFCPGSINTSTPTFTITPTITGTIFTNTPTSTVTNTISPTPNQTLTPDCGASAQIFGSTNITPTPINATYPNEMWASRYTMPSDGMIETIALYAPPADVGFQANVALYTNNTSTTVMGSLVNQSAPQALTSGWNLFKIPNSPVTAGDYWLTYNFSSGPSTYYVVYQGYATPTPNTQAYVVYSGPSLTFPVNAATLVPTYTSGSQPIYANYCPGPLNTPTATPTSTITMSPTPTGTSTLTGTPTLSATQTPSGTPSYTPTVTFTATQTGTPTSTATLTLTFTLSNTPTVTLSFTPTYSPTITSTSSFTSLPTFTPTSTLTGTPTFTATFTSTFTITNTPNLTLTATSTPTSTGTSSFTGTPSSTDSMTPTASLTATPSVTPTNSPAATSTFSPTPSSTGTFTLTPSLTWTYTVSSTISSTPTYSPTATPSFTYSPTASITSTPSGTPTRTGTGTPVVSATTTPILYPNPLKGPGPIHLVLTFDKPHDYVTVKIFTTAFRKVYESTSQFVPSGVFVIDIDPDHFKGSSAANGLYYVVVMTPSNHWISKLLILK